jgi:hypothetical protein
MMRRVPAGAASLLLVLLVAVPATALAPKPVEVRVGILLENPAAYASPGVPAITVQGELVGDFGIRDDGTVWTQLNDDGYADTPLLEGGRLFGFNRGIGVHIPEALWPGFDSAGGYRVQGPVVRLSGEWRFRDPERGGESYLEVTAVEVLSGPVRLDEGVHWLPLGIGLGLLATAGAVLLAARLGRGRGDSEEPVGVVSSRSGRSHRDVDRRRR